MKRMTCLFLALLLLCALPLSARADVIYEPNDDFYSDHRDEMTLWERSYTTRTDVTLYASPVSPVKTASLRQGDSVYVYYLYTDPDGNQWGFVDTYLEEKDAWVTGWLPLAYCALVYDDISFAEDYGHLFRDESGEVAAVYLGQDIILYPYPGALEGSTLPMDSYGPTFTQTYTDETGHVWGFVGYYFGHRNSWVCLDNPTAGYTTLYPNGGPEITPETSLPPLPQEEIVPKGNPLTQTGVTIAVVACVAVAGFLLWRMKKKSAA